MKTSTWLVAVGLVFNFSAAAQLLDVKGDLQTNDVSLRSFPFQAKAGRILLNLSIETRPGTVTCEVHGPNGTLLGSQSAGSLTMGGWALSITNAGRHTLEIKPHRTAGRWAVRIEQLPPLSLLYAQCLSGGLMMLVAVAGVLAWKLHARVQWRWFWAGAGIWTVGVALKFAAAVPLNHILFPSHEPIAGWKLLGGSLYSGLMTGVFEIGITLAAALVWRRLAAEPNRAVAVGLGAGAFEAFLLGMGALGGSLGALATGQGEQMLKALAGVSAHTQLLWLIGSVERVIAILAHTAARVLVLRAVASHSWLGFWAGFGWLSALDLIAGAVLLSGMITSYSMWWVELSILPFGVLSIPLIRWARRKWPATAAPSTLAELPTELGPADKQPY